MSNQFGYSKTITNNLYFNLDASDNNSYPGSGTIAYDLVNKNNTCTLTGGVGFDSAGIKAFTFNGTSHYMIKNSPVLPTGTVYKTMLCWCYPDSTGPSNTYTGLVSYGGKSTLTPSTAMVLSLNTSAATWHVGSAYWGNDYNTSNLAVVKDEWNFVGIIARTFADVNNTTLICGNSSGFNTLTGSSTNYSKGLSTVASVLTIGCTDSPGRYMKGKIAKVLIYGEELSIDEISYIFNMQRTRFGI